MATDLSMEFMLRITGEIAALWDTKSPEVQRELATYLCATLGAIIDRHPQVAIEFQRVAAPMLQAHMREVREMVLAAHREIFSPKSEGGLN